MTGIIPRGFRYVREEEPKERESQAYGRTEAGNPTRHGRATQDVGGDSETGRTAHRQYKDNPKRIEGIIMLTIAAWNKGMFPSEKQDGVEKDIIDAFVPPDGSAESVAVILEVMDLIEERRKRLFPNLRKIIVTYDLKVVKGRLSLNVGSAAIPTDR